MADAPTLPAFDYEAIRRRALAGIDPSKLNAFMTNQWFAPSKAAYDQMAQAYTNEDYYDTQARTGYERNLAEMIRQRADAQRGLNDAMANRGMYSSGARLTSEQDLMGRYQQVQDDLGRQLDDNLRSSIARRMAAQNAYNSSLAGVESGMAGAANTYLQDMAKQEAQALTQQQIMAAIQAGGSGGGMAPARPTGGYSVTPPQPQMPQPRQQQQIVVPPAPNSTKPRVATPTVVRNAGVGLSYQPSGTRKRNNPVAV